MYIPCEASSWNLLHQNRKLSSRISLQNHLFCLCRLPAVLLYKLDKLLWNKRSYPYCRIFNTGRFFFFDSTVSYTYNHCAGTVDYRTTGIHCIRLLIKFLTVYTCIIFHFRALSLGAKGVFYSFYRFRSQALVSFKKYMPPPLLYSRDISLFDCHI